MHPIAFTLGSLTIRWYGIAIAVAIAISISAAYVESRRQGINTDNVLDMAIAAILGGIAGARIGWVLTSPDVAWYLVHPLQVIAIWNGGLSYFGAIIGGVIAAHWVVRRRHMDFWQMADIAAPLLALSFGIGKIGCWLNGCCNGTVTTSFLGVTFTDPLSECDLLGQKVWPAQLFNSASGFLVFVILAFVVRRHKRYNGQVFVWYLYLYGATSFIVEFFRSVPVHVLGLTPNQWTDVIIIVAGAVATPLLRRHYQNSPPGPGQSDAALPDQNEPDPDA